MEELAGDNALALSDDGGETWKCRRETKEARVVVVDGDGNDEDGGDGANAMWLQSMWYPWKDVEVETWLVPPTLDAPAWHVRVHRIRTGRALTSAEGGFAIYGQRED